MAFVIAEPCIGEKDASCVASCPVDCIRPTPQEPEFAEAEHLHIDPETCIDCGACEPVCPVEAIFPEEDLPEKWAAYAPSNAAWFPAPGKALSAARRKAEVESLREGG